MKLANAHILLLFLAAFGYSQSAAERLVSNPYESVCGRPLADGKVYDYREGQISSITKDNELVFQQKELNGIRKIETIRIRLVGVALKNSDIRVNAFLKKTLVNRDVVVAGNKRDASDREMTATVWVSSVNDLSQHLLTKTMAAFEEPDYDAVSAYSLCVLRQIAEKRQK